MSKSRIVKTFIVIVLVILGLSFVVSGFSVGVLIGLVVVGLLLWGAYSVWTRNRSIVECPNCHRRMSYQRFKDAGGCPKCGTDLYIRSK